MNRYAFAGLVRAELARTGLSQTALALRLGIDQSWVSNLLKGYRPSPELAIRFAAWAGIDPREALRAAGYWPRDVVLAPEGAAPPEGEEAGTLAAKLAGILAEHPDLPPQAVVELVQRTASWPEEARLLLLQVARLLDRAVNNPTDGAAEEDGRRRPRARRAPAAGREAVLEG